MSPLDDAQGKQPQGRKLVIISNRLPIVLTKTEDGQWSIGPGSGGLVTAMAPVLRDRGGLWIGWPGTSGVPEAELGELLNAGSRDVGYTLAPVALTDDEVRDYYHGFSNEVIWPLFHDLQTRCNFDPRYWDVYQQVNRKFAEVIGQRSEPDDYVWVHDYHLMLVARELRRSGIRRRTGYFLHTPFPPLDIFLKLPWRSDVLEGLMEYDLIGFQTTRDRNNFLHCLELLERQPHPDTRRRVTAIVTPGREIRTGTFPISIDFAHFDRLARDKTVHRRAEEIRSSIQGTHIILGVDRLDYTKGIPERLRAFKRALERFDDLRGRMTLVQVVVPSRVHISEYQQLRAEIEGLVGEINGTFAHPGWVPVNYIFRSLERPELVAYYRAADIAFVTPLKDGMNLIAKEYCAANVDRRGVLLLSEFAGAADQLGRYALLVNPYDIEGVADAIHRAHLMPLDERERRMRRLRRAIRTRDIFWWLDSFLSVASTDASDAIPEEASR